MNGTCATDARLVNDTCGGTEPRTAVYCVAPQWAPERMRQKAALATRTQPVTCQRSICTLQPLSHRPDYPSAADVALLP